MSQPPETLLTPFFKTVKCLKGWKFQIFITLTLATLRKKWNNSALSKIWVSLQKHSTPTPFFKTVNVGLSEWYEGVKKEQKRNHNGICELIFRLWLSKLSEIEISENSSSIKSLTPGNSHWEWNSYELKSKVLIKSGFIKKWLRKTQIYKKIVQ